MMADTSLAINKDQETIGKYVLKILSDYYV